MLESCGIWSNHVKGEPLKERAAEEDQTAWVRGEDLLGLEDNTLIEKIEDAYENKINLRRVYEVKKAICELKQGKGGFNQYVRKLQYLWSYLRVLRPHTLDPGVIQEWQEQDIVFSLLASMELSYGWLVELILKEDRLPDMEEMCVLVQRVQTVMKENKKITWSKESVQQKKGRWRRIYKAQIRRGRCWKRSILSGYQDCCGPIKMGREAAQRSVMGECSYSALIGGSLDETMGLREQKEEGRADDPITRKEWGGVHGACTSISCKQETWCTLRSS